MDKIQIRTIFLFQFKLGRKAAEPARDINDAFGPGTTNERVAQRWFKKFRSGDKSLKDEDGRSRPIQAAPIYPTFLTSLFALNGERLLSGRPRVQQQLLVWLCEDQLQLRLSNVRY